MVGDFINSQGGELVAEYTEVESGKADDRPELLAAMKKAELVGGKLLVGKLDRLKRSLHFITSLQAEWISSSVTCPGATHSPSTFMEP